MFDDSMKQTLPAEQPHTASVDSFMQRQDLCRVVFSTAGNIVAVTDAFTQEMGRPAEDLVGRPFWDFIDLDSLDQTMVVLDRLGLHRGVDGFVNCYRNAAGERVWLDWTCPGAGPDGLLYASASVLGPPPAGKKYVVGVRGFDAEVI